ncbi:glycosyltransferase family 2 protein [Microbacterium sp. MRS-1]|uniref:glycosyltransferase family 2 protein n=1 Tax=Microbacterium sp. MRS-1 TaxID=1451261 RepID=UPI0004B0AD29|nr:glycosyltransferase family A protein [Microbacterium sp. MRS-1]
MTSPPLMLVVTTLGRVLPLRRLLDSAVPQLGPDDRIVVVAQGNVADVQALVEGADALGRVRALTSARGASLGRNTGIAALADAGDEALVMFPNDTTWFPADSIATIRRLVADAPGGAVTVSTEIGPRFTLPTPGTALDTSTVWNVIEMSLVIRLGLLREVGGFDTGIGTGAASPWQAGEVTDLLMRALAAEPLLAREFVWTYAHDVHVGGIAETAGLDPRERRWKLRAYGRGVGRVLARHPFPLWHRWGFVAAGALVGLRRGNEYRPWDGIAAVVGRLEGVVGRTFRSREATAVKR